LPCLALRPVVSPALRRVRCRGCVLHAEVELEPNPEKRMDRVGEGLST
jgi:hypothetical protein